MSRLADDFESHHLPGAAGDPPHHSGARAKAGKQAADNGVPLPDRHDALSDPPSTLVYRWRRDPPIVISVRRLLVWHLAAWDMQELADVAQLVVSELVTNAVRHAHGPDDTLVETRFERLPGGDLRIEVHDANENTPELHQLSPDAESGRGLALVDALTGGRWGVSGREGIGKVVWAECAADDDSSQTAAEVREGRRRERPRRLHQEPEAVTWAREKSGLTKRRLAELVGISEQLMGEVESGWRSATPANLAKIAQALNCPIVVLERRSPGGTGTQSQATP
jgi:DNA-binding XRE family transcriptional regulator